MPRQVFPNGLAFRVPLNRRSNQLEPNPFNKSSKPFWCADTLADIVVRESRGGRTDEDESLGKKKVFLIIDSCSVEE